jgi:uncharacterized ubiquitin-like protein YukD
MSQVVITLKHSHNQRHDLALPMDVRAAILAPAIGQALKLSVPQGQTFKLTVLDGKVRRVIESSETLLDANVMFGDILEIEETAQETPSSPPPQALVGWLQFENGEVFRLNPTSTSIGRWSPGNNVDVDLAGQDEKKQVSRQHAIIENRYGHYVIIDDSANGTWLQRKRIPKKEPQPLNSGDLLEFGGSHGVRLKFLLKPK